MKKKKRYKCGGMVLALSCVILIVLLGKYMTRVSENDSRGNLTEQETLEAADGGAAQAEDVGTPEPAAGTESEMETEAGAESRLMEPELEPDSLDMPETMGSSGTADMSDSDFYWTELTDEIKSCITGISYPDSNEEMEITYDDLAYVHVLYYDFNGETAQGELICNRLIAQDLVEIFSALYEARYPIEKIRLIDDYGGDDEASMQDNNTSCFNYRTVPGSTHLSNHAYGLAVDVNPQYNPYVRTRGGETLISPDNAAVYADRSADFPYKIDADDLCYQLFMEHGFRWGGAWKNEKDYQHFEKTN